MPTPATSPLVFKRDAAALVVAPKPESSSDAVARDNKSGLVVEGNLVRAIGVLLVELPEYMVSTPRALADSSDISTIIASTKTCGLLISNCLTIEVRVLIV